MMKQVIRFTILLMLSFLITKGLVAQELPEILQRVLQTDTAYQSISCTVNIQVDVPGLNMPEKDIYLELEKDKKPKIKSKGLIILPKRGIIGQYREFLNQACQAIPMGENGDTITYKVVSLDKKTDWVTVDLSITKTDVRVQHMLIATRKNGEYEVKHSYGAESDIFPAHTIISFEAMPLKLPLKFLGQQEGMESLEEQDGPVTGKVILDYSNIELKKEME